MSTNKCFSEIGKQNIFRDSAKFFFSQYLLFLSFLPQLFFSL